MADAWRDAIRTSQDSEAMHHKHGSFGTHCPENRTPSQKPIILYINRTRNGHFFVNFRAEATSMGLGLGLGLGMPEPNESEPSVLQGMPVSTLLAHMTKFSAWLKVKPRPCQGPSAKSMGCRLTRLLRSIELRGRFVARPTSFWLELQNTKAQLALHSCFMSLPPSIPFGSTGSLQTLPF